MRIRQRRKILHPSQNLDSFLDILTNTVGVLMFISLFVSLLAVESGNIIKTPLVSNTNKIPFFFEVRDNQVMYIDTPKIQQQIDNLLESLPKCNEPEIPDNFSSYLYEYYLQEYESYRDCVSELENKINGFRGDTDYYSARFIELNALIYEPKNNVQGESIEELSEDKSNFQQLLNSLDKRENYLAFIVRPDSFNGFRMARKKALEAGFDVGWEPSETDIPIVFGSGGRSIGVQ
jgi:hypothetical protein